MARDAVVELSPSSNALAKLPFHLFVSGSVVENAVPDGLVRSTSVTPFGG